MSKISVKRSPNFLIAQASLSFKAYEICLLEIDTFFPGLNTPNANGLSKDKHKKKNEKSRS